MRRHRNEESIRKEQFLPIRKETDRFGARNEVLVLRCQSGTWTAFDSAVSANGLTLRCRQPVFRCLATDITQPGWHTWQTNYAASPNDAGVEVDWEGALPAETRVP